MKFKEKAVKAFNNDYNCAQSVLSSFAPVIGISEEEAFSIARPFGAGISYRGEMCGAVSGALMVLGMKLGKTKGDEDYIKEITHYCSNQFLKKFETINGSVICKNLLGKDISIPEEMNKLREEKAFENICPKMVESSADILEDLLHSIDTRIK